MTVSNVSGQTTVKSIGHPVYNIGGAVMNNFMKGLLISNSKQKKSTDFKKEGGQVGVNDEEMVDGIADLLTKVKDPKNRKDIFLQMIQDFDKEGIEFNKKDFKKRANVFQKGGINNTEGSFLGVITSMFSGSEELNAKEKKKEEERKKYVASRNVNRKNRLKIQAEINKTQKEQDETEAKQQYLNTGTQQEQEAKKSVQKAESLDTSTFSPLEMKLYNQHLDSVKNKKTKVLNPGPTDEKQAKEMLKKMQAINTSTFSEFEMQIYNRQIADLKKKAGFLKKGSKLKFKSVRVASQYKTGGKLKLKFKSGGSVKDSMKCWEVKRSARERKKIMKLYCIDGKKKLVHAGAKGYTHEGKPSKSDSPAQKKRRTNFHARHNCKDAKPGTAKHLACTELW